MTTRAMPMCMVCDHRTDPTDGPPRCEAYPDGIPMALWLGGADHRLPLPDDHGIQFKLDVEADRLFPDYVPDVYGAEPTAYDGAWPDPPPDPTD